MSKTEVSVKDIKLNHKDDCREVVIFIIKHGFGELVTEDKKIAYDVWSALSESFFELKKANGGYNEPDFLYKDECKITLESNRVEIWKDSGKANMANSAYKALVEAKKEADKNKSKQKLSKE